MTWILALTGVGSLILRIGLSAAAPFDWSVPHKVALSIVYWIIVGYVAALTCLSTLNLGLSLHLPSTSL